ncbi:MAG: ABC transporter ATP-binding protein [Proteobacteria bacterium]|nr:ABC transporter ATP-binding protein [Pseudomonadota bacterium]
MKIIQNPKIYHLFCFLIHFMKPQKGLFIVLILGLFAWPLEQSFFPYFIKLIIDGLTRLESLQIPLNEMPIFKDLGKILLLGLVFFLVTEFIYRSSDFLRAFLLPPYMARLRTYLIEYVARQSFTYFSNNFPGAIANKINDLPRAAYELFDTICTSFIPGILNGLIAILLLFMLSPLLGLIMMGWFVLHLRISWVASKKASLYAKDQSEALSTLSGKIVDALNNIFTIRLFNGFHYEKKYLDHYQTSAVQKYTKTLAFSAKLKTILGILGLLEYTAMISASLYGWKMGWLTLGDVAFILTILQNIMQSTWWVTYEFPHLFEQIGISLQAYDLLTQKITIQEIPGAPALNVTKGEIVFDNVSFHHTSNSLEHPVLFKNLNLTLKGGEKIGVVGFSGSGKTTFVNLILRQFDPQQGRILIDGQDIKDVSQASLWNAISVIPQDTSLFHRTLYENIHYGNLTASRDDVLIAAQKAHASEFISLLPHGYETVVGERGGNLSGGERQRIAIARSILKNAPILILDEATSALDYKTEKNIQESLLTAMKNRTSIVIAHRLSTLSRMDRILVFQKGEIIESGTHQELLNLNGFYKYLFSLQSNGFLQETNDSVL